MQKASQAASLGKPREAVAMVEQAAAAGNNEALLALANWRLFGTYGPRNVAEAHGLLERAALAGDVEAGRLRAFLIGNGTGCRSDPEEARSLTSRLADRDAFCAFQMAFLPRMMPEENVGQLKQEVLSADPSIRLVKGLLLEAECRYLTALAEPALQPSSVVDPRTGRRIPHPVRTSWGTSFGPTQEDLVVHAINRRLASVTGTEVGWGEPLHVLRYADAQEYKPHVDALPGVTNQRVWTVLIYLNHGYDGGETRFTNLGLSVRGNEGDALIFRNVTEEGASDGRTQHAGLPITAGTKWLATRWIRAGPYDPWSSE